ncbi:hypothetical protein RUM43_013299 [Polyplax serrata]|uniref:WW domain-containing protein n=1 Tax=Polyplax serrata TaxID=468196 RepID=A0AAN8P1S4_POLSC
MSVAKQEERQTLSRVQKRSGMRSIGSDWTEYITSSRVYYSNTVAKEKTWKLPSRDGATLNIQEGSAVENNRSRNQNYDNIGRLLRTGVLKIKQETASCKWVKSTIFFTELHVLVTWLFLGVLEVAGHRLPKKQLRCSNGKSKSSTLLDFTKASTIVKRARFRCVSDYFGAGAGAQHRGVD